MIRRPTGRSWPLLLALLASALALGSAAPSGAFAAADLAVTVTDTPDPAVPGDMITVQATVRNNGNETAYDVQVAFGAITNATVASAPGCQTLGQDSNFASCGVGNLAISQSKTAAITLRFPIDVPINEVSLDVNATSADINGDPVTDPTPADNHVHVTTTVEPRADLKLDLTAATPVTIGNTSTVTATVTNTRDGPARATQLKFVVPPELPVASLPEGCTASGLRVTCDLGLIPSQGTATRSIVYQVPVEGSFILIGSVSWSKPDPTPENAQVQVTITGLSPIEPEGGGPPVTPAPKPTLPTPQDVPITLFTKGLPSGKRCIRTRSLRFKLRRPSGVPLTQADVYLGKRRVKRITGILLRRTVVISGLPRAAYKVTVVVSLRDGGRLRGRLSLRACR